MNLNHKARRSQGASRSYLSPFQQQKRVLALAGHVRTAIEFDAKDGCQYAIRRLKSYICISARSLRPSL